MVRKHGFKLSDFPVLAATIRNPYDLEVSAPRSRIAGFPQLYITDPDRNVIEINAEKLDAEPAEA